MSVELPVLLCSQDLVGVGTRRTMCPYMTHTTNKYCLNDPISVHHCFNMNHILRLHSCLLAVIWKWRFRFSFSVNRTCFKPYLLLWSRSKDKQQHLDIFRLTRKHHVSCPVKNEQGKGQEKTAWKNTDEYNTTSTNRSQLSYIISWQKQVREQQMNNLDPAVNVDHHLKLPWSLSLFLLLDSFVHLSFPLCHSACPDDFN